MTFAFVPNTTRPPDLWAWWADKWLKSSEGVFWSSKLLSTAFEVLSGSEWVKPLVERPLRVFQGATGCTSLFRLVGRVTPLREACRGGMRVRIIREFAFFVMSLLFTISSFTLGAQWRYRASVVSLVNYGIDAFGEVAEYQALKRSDRAPPDLLTNQRLKICRAVVALLASLLVVAQVRTTVVAVVGFLSAGSSLYVGYHKDMVCNVHQTEPLTPWVPRSPRNTPSPIRSSPVRPARSFTPIPQEEPAS